jgi:hypothetical protein
MAKLQPKGLPSPRSMAWSWVGILAATVLELRLADVRHWRAGLVDWDGQNQWCSPAGVVWLLHSMHRLYWHACMYVMFWAEWGVASDAIDTDRHWVGVSAAWCDSIEECDSCLPRTVFLGSLLHACRVLSACSLCQGVRCQYGLGY